MFLHFCVGIDLHIPSMTTTTTTTTTTVHHKPGITLTVEQRSAKSREHTFGLCEYCDTGLDLRSDFICHTPTNRGFKLMCNACHEYYNPGRSPNFEF